MLNQWFAEKVLTKNVPREREKWQQMALAITLPKKTLKMCRLKMHIEITFGYSTTQKLHFLSKSVSLIFLYFAKRHHGLMCSSSYSYQYKIMQGITVLAFQCFFSSQLSYNPGQNISPLKFEIFLIFPYFLRS